MTGQHGFEEDQWAELRGMVLREAGTIAVSGILALIDGLRKMHHGTSAYWLDKACELPGFVEYDFGWTAQRVASGYLVTLNSPRALAHSSDGLTAHGDTLTEASRKLFLTAKNRSTPGEKEG